jgi:hypothetical protein
MVIKRQIVSEVYKGSKKHPVCNGEIGIINNDLEERGEMIKNMIILKESEQKLIYENSILLTQLELARKTTGENGGNLRCSGNGYFPSNDVRHAEERPRGYLQKDEVAKRLNKSTRWVEQQCKSGVIPYIKIKRSVLFDWDEVIKSLGNFSRGGVVRRY